MKKVTLCIALLFVSFAALFFAGSSSAGAQAGEKLYELKYQMAEGTRFVIKSDGITESVTDQMGMEMVAEITGGGEDTYTVLSANPDKSLSMELEMGEQVQDVSSDQGSASTDFSALVGKKVKFTLSPNGEVSDFDGFDELPEIPTATGDVLTSDLYILGVKESFIRLPDKPVKMGDTWTDVRANDVPLGGATLRSESDYTYKLVEEAKKDGFDCLKIAIAGKEKLTGDFEQAGTALSIDRETQVTGFLYFAFKQGMFISIEAESKAEGVIVVQIAGQEIPQTITTKGTVSVRFLQ